jgi:hypothetical protein
LSEIPSHATIRNIVRQDITKGCWLPRMKHLAAGLLTALIAVSPAWAEDQSTCATAPPVLWGDGEHDDTAALNAWFRGETVLWAQTHEAVGS